MGMSIKEARIALGKERKYALHENKQAFDIAIDTMRKYQMMQADYENRLKADMVAMLKDLDLKIDEMYEPQFSKEGMDGFYWAQGLFKDLVQEQINALRGNENA